MSSPRALVGFPPGKDWDNQASFRISCRFSKRNHVHGIAVRMSISWRVAIAAVKSPLARIRLFHNGSCRSPGSSNIEVSTVCSMSSCMKHNQVPQLIERVPRMFVQDGGVMGCLQSLSTSIRRKRSAPPSGAQTDSHASVTTAEGRSGTTFVETFRVGLPFQPVLDHRQTDVTSPALHQSPVLDLDESSVSSCCVQLHIVLMKRMMNAQSKMQQLTSDGAGEAGMGGPRQEISSPKNKVTASLSAPSQENGRLSGQMKHSRASVMAVVIRITHMLTALHRDETALENGERGGRGERTVERRQERRESEERELREERASDMRCCQMNVVTTETRNGQRPW